MKPFQSGVLLVLLASASGSVLHAQGEAEKIAEEARVRAARQDHAGAEKILTGALSRSDPEWKPADRAVLLFNLGWILGRQADAGGPDRDAILGRAARAYRGVLELFPANSQAAVNLALILEQAGDAAAAEKLLTGLRGGRGPGDARVGLALGDLYRRTDRPEQAWRTWMGLAERDPEMRAAHERLIGLYRIREGAWSPEPRSAYEYCTRLDRSGFTVLAQQGLASLAGSTFRRDPALAEQALIAWTDLGVRNGTLDHPGALSVLPSPEHWPSPALTGLRTLVRGPADGDREAAWWMQDALRRHVAAGVVRARGRRLEERGDAAAAIETYIESMKVAPEVHAYSEELRSIRSAARLDAALDLARLLHRERARVDPDGRRLQDLVGRLFEGKNEMYREHDLPGIRRYHETLGTIASDRQRWSEVVYHFNRAIESADELARREDRRSDASPHLYRLLSDALQARGEYEDAARQTIRAVQGFRDLGDKSSAEAALNAFKHQDALPADRRREVEEVDRFLRELDGIEKTPESDRRKAFEDLQRRAPAPRGQGSLLPDHWAGPVLDRVTYDEELQALRKGDRSSADRWRQEADDVQRKFRVPKADPKRAATLRQARKTSPDPKDVPPKPRRDGDGR